MFFRTVYTKAGKSTISEEIWTSVGLMQPFALRLSENITVKKGKT